MIVDKLENAGKYMLISKRIEKALGFLIVTDFSALAIGKHEIDGDRIFALVNEYETKLLTDCKPETHQKYIDIQCLLVGEEYIGLGLITNQRPTEEYNEGKDVAFYDEPTSLVKFEPGMFGIFFPHDLHQPCIMIHRPEKVRKVVIKVMVDE